MAFELSKVLSTSSGGSFSSHRKYSMIVKDHLEIHKFDRFNFVLWKNQMRDEMIQRKQLKPFSGEAARLEGMTNDDWEELNLLSISTIDRTQQTMYTPQSSTMTRLRNYGLNYVVPMRRSSDQIKFISCENSDKYLHLKGTNSVVAHFNEFDALQFQLLAQKMTMDDE